LVNVKLAEGVYTEKQKHEMAARLTDVMVAVWVGHTVTTAGAHGPFS